MSTLEGIKSCMTFYPRACGSMRVNDGAATPPPPKKMGVTPPKKWGCLLPTPPKLCFFTPKQGKLAAYFLARIDSESPRVQEVGGEQQGGDPKIGGVWGDALRVLREDFLWGVFGVGLLWVWGSPGGE